MKASIGLCQWTSKHNLICFVHHGKEPSVKRRAVGRHCFVVVNLLFRCSVFVVLCCAVLCAVALCCAVLWHCAVLCCVLCGGTVLCCAVLCVLCCAVAVCCAVRWDCAVLWHCAVCCAVLCCAVLCCAVLCCAVLCCAVFHLFTSLCCGRELAVAGRAVVEHTAPADQQEVVLVITAREVVSVKEGSYRCKTKKYQLPIHTLFLVSIQSPTAEDEG